MPEQKDHLKPKVQTEGQRLSLNQGFEAERNKLLWTAEMKSQCQGRWIRAWGSWGGWGLKGLSEHTGGSFCDIEDDVEGIRLVLQGLVTEWKKGNNNGSEGALVHAQGSAHSWVRSEADVQVYRKSWSCGIC